MQRTDDLLCLLLSYMRVGVGVGRGVIVIVIGMVMVRVIRVIVGTVRLRWRMAINMIVVLTIRKCVTISIRAERYPNKEADRGIGKGARGRRWWGRINFIRLAFFAPHFATRKVARWLGDSTNRSSLPRAARNPQHTGPGPGPRGSMILSYSGRPPQYAYRIVRVVVAWAG